MSNIRNSKYGALVLTFSDKFKEMRKLSNALNWASGHFGEIIKAVKKNAEGLDKDDRVRMFSYVPVFRYLLNFKQIDLWNPCFENDPLKPNKEERRLLGNWAEVTAEEYMESDEIDHWELDEVEKLRLAELTKYNKGGISVFRLCQIAYGICELLIPAEGEKNENGIVVIGQKTAKEIENGEYDELFFTLAERYHNRDDKTSKTDDVEKSDVIPTLEAFEAGEITPSDVESVETLQQWYQQTESAGKKGAITREINKRENKKQKV